MAKSKDDTFLIESYQLSRISIYGTGIKVAYFDHNRKRRLKIIGRKSSCGIVMIFCFSYEEKLLICITVLKRIGGIHISDIILK